MPYRTTRIADAFTEVVHEAEDRLHSQDVSIADRQSLRFKFRVEEPVIALVSDPVVAVIAQNNNCPRSHVSDTASPPSALNELCSASRRLVLNDRPYRAVVESDFQGCGRNDHVAGGIDSSILATSTPDSEAAWSLETVPQFFDQIPRLPFPETARPIRKDG